MTRLPPRLFLVLLLSLPLLRAALPPCATDLDCSLNGVCDAASGVCACDAPWVSDVDGESTVGCSFLDALPSPAGACGPACVFHGGPSSLDASWTSWGMSVISAGGAFHGYVAEMANECGLGAWTRGSQVVHAAAAAPTGPFLRGPAGADVVVPAWAHNPQVIRAPDGNFVIFTLGDGWPQNGAPLNCSKGGGAADVSAAAAAAVAAAEAEVEAPRQGHGPLGRYGNCSVQSPAPNNCDPNPCWTCNVTVHVSATPDAAGPWTPHTVVINGLSNYDNLLNWNPSPMVLANGSVAVMIHTNDNQGW
jgi:hypothetical protein